MFANANVDGKRRDSTHSPPSYEDAIGEESHSSGRDSKQQDSTSAANRLNNLFGCFGRSFRIKPLSQYERLKQTEFDNPGLIFCASCNAVHKRPTRDEGRFDIGGPSCAANSRSQKLSLGGCRSLTWWQVHLAVRAERFTPAHGIPLCGKVEEWDCWNWHYTSRFKMMDDRLLVRIWATKTFTLMDRDEDLDNAPCCVHLQGSKKFRQALKDDILRFAAAGAPNILRSSLYTCFWCPSEARIAVSRLGDGKNASRERGDSALGEELYQLEVSRYIDVGRCESIKSLEWSSLTTTTAKGGWRLPSLFLINSGGRVERQLGGRMLNDRGVRCIYGYGEAGRHDDGQSWSYYARGGHSSPHNL
ncbi:MAG: hypothetical protein M1828_003339 [Chrysothrix sp. TS-e1954]|nr:MAG: hypothetical protein M1828_003339 [Chrysothrix sp. TS-e1954]